MGKKSRGKAARRRGDAPAPRSPDTTDVSRDIGLRVVDELHRLLFVDEEWTAREDRGFTWWAHRHPQRIWAEPVATDLDTRVARVHIETTFVRAAKDREALLRVSSAANVMTALSAITADPEEGTATLHGAATVHAENRSWLV